jgi:3-deoxy-D-manno-octulosonate 8-phosphate phosphatase (KDO 8-P phosphatase)
MSAHGDGDAMQRARRVRMMIFDVDGVLTDGVLYLGDNGTEIKAFHVRDGHGLKMLKDSGVKVGILSARRSRTVELRAAELGIEIVTQGASDKGTAFLEMLQQQRIAAESTAYMGDDLQDLPVMVRCGFAVTVPEAPLAVRERAHYVTRAGGGRGAAREVCEFIMQAQQTLGGAVQRQLA